MLPYDWITQAAERISNHIVHTPVLYDKDLNIFLKFENKQVTGSFKIRGALNKILTLEPWELAQGLVTASAGNHGQGVALSGKIVGTPVVVFASDHAVPSKLDAIRKLGAEIKLVTGGYGLAEQTAIEFASLDHKTFISPYNDGQVISGQATIALEVLQDVELEPGMSWVVPVGGGGMISGIGSVLHGGNTSSKLIGVQPEASAFASALFHKGVQTNVTDLPTLADGLSGPVQEGSITIPLMNNLVDDIITVTEEDIEQGIAYAWYKFHEKIEGSAAASISAVLTGKVKTPALVILSGGNIQPEVHAQICQKYSGRS